jgi:hypothetical protein
MTTAADIGNSWFSAPEFPGKPYLSERLLLTYPVRC